MRLPRFGKHPDPEPQARLHPLMQAHYDPTLPVWVASDHAIWGTFDDVADGVLLADRIGPSEPVGVRTVVTVMGVSIYQVPGEAPATTRAAQR